MNKATKLKSTFGQDRWIKVPARCVAMAAPFISDDETRYYLQGIYIEPVKEGALLVSTDGHRMGIVRSDDERTTCKAPFICPVSKSLLAAIADGSTSWAVYAGDKVFLVKDSDVELVSSPADVDSVCLYLEKAPAIDGSFPNWRGVVPKEMRGHGDALGINSEFVRSFRKVSRAAGANDTLFQFYLSGSPHEPVVVRHHAIPEFFGLQMPTKMVDVKPLPAWLAAE